MQPENRVVIDTNIIISAAISLDGTPAKIFELFLGKKIANYTTEEIIDEVEEVINRTCFKECISDEYRKFILDNFKLHSIIIRSAFNEKVVAEDEADDKFINCALSANADIVSGDIHLLKLKNYRGISILSARGFLNTFREEK